MEIKVRQGDIAQTECDVLVVNLFEGVTTPSGTTAAVDEATGKLISSYAIKDDKFEAKFGQTYIVPTYGKIPAKKVLLVGLGKQENLEIDKIRELNAKIIKKCISVLKPKKICSMLHGASIRGFAPYECARMIAEGVILGSYKFDKYKSEKSKYELQEFEIVEINPDIISEVEKGAKKGEEIAKATNFARNLVNEPAAYANPEKLAQIAQSFEGLETKILTKGECEELGMNAYLAVSQGSNNEPKFIHMTYKKENPKKKIAIVGKGVTFDSGGLNLKPASAMRNMKDDMSGAATVLGIMQSLVKLNPDIEVHGIIAACENMPDGKSYRQGDILTAMNGKTIEVDNTDAEGRLTLADALCYAETLGVDEIIDIATLTGACLVALGYLASGVMGNSKELIENLIKSGQKGGERLWELPMYKEYKDGLKSSVADIANSGARFGGASAAGVFLNEFVKDAKWAHIDIAGPAFLDKEYFGISKGPSGAGVRTLLNYILD